MSIEAMRELKTLASVCPELNMANYTEDDVRHLNDWAIEMSLLAEKVAAIQQAESEPVLTVEKEPDYWSGGHFHEGQRPHIDPTKVWKLPIGTKLYTRPAPGVPEEKPLPELMLASYHEAVGWNACRAAMLAAK